MLNEKVNEAPFMARFREIIGVIYSNWWAERNGGNISYLLEDDDVIPYIKDTITNRNIALSIPAPELAKKYFLVTGSGKYYRNIAKVNETIDNAGILQISDDGKSYNIVWGFENGAVATSELPAHLQSHIARLKQNQNHRVVIHSHPTNIVALTFTEELDDNSFTKKMWEMISEASVVFPEGIGILPWMVPGSNEIGLATARKMQQYRSVIWAHHGIFCTGDSLDEALGLLECIEKSAKIYMRILQTGKPILNKIQAANFQAMAEFFGFTLKEGVVK